MLITDALTQASQPRPRPISFSRRTLFIDRNKRPEPLEFATGNPVICHSTGTGDPVATGPEAISKFWEAAINAGFKDHTFDIVEAHMDGNLTYLSTRTVKQVKADGDAGSMSGNTLGVLEKEGYGSWKTKIHTFIPLRGGNNEVDSFGPRRRCDNRR
jgi:hypothetical protein